MTIKLADGGRKFTKGEVRARLYGDLVYKPQEPLMCKKLCVRFASGQCPCAANLPNEGCDYIDPGVTDELDLIAKVNSVLTEISHRDHFAYA